MQKPFKIMICGHERHIISLLEVNFLRQGYQVITAYSREECLAKIQSETPDLVVLDDHVPNVDGSDGLESLQHELETMNLRYNVLTSRRLQPDLAEVLRGSGLDISRSRSLGIWWKALHRNMDEKHVVARILFYLLKWIVLLIFMVLCFVFIVDLLDGPEPGPSGYSSPS